MPINPLTMKAIQANHRRLNLVRTMGLLVLWLGTLLVGAEEKGAPKIREPEDFTSLSLEQLGSIKITSVSKKSEPLAAAPAAVSVITGDDIRRSGALSLPEALRLAPGMSIAKVGSQEWAVSARGFNDTFAQKLLVLMDGRSIYTPLFSGTFWQAQDTMLEDLERIEVVRGPGGTVWGANAVNGVINIVSKPARETQGLLLSGGGGSQHTALAGVRYGVQLGTNTYFRLYGKYDDWNHSQLVEGGDAFDAWWKAQGGFRLDWEPTSADRFTLQGDLFSLRADTQIPQIVLPIFSVPAPSTGYNYNRRATWNQNGGNVLGRWTHQFSEDSDLSLQTYYDRGRFAFPIIEETRDTFDLDLRHRFQMGQHQEIVWGGGYRVSRSRISDSPSLNLNRDLRSDQIFNAFVQDEIKLVPERLRWTLGTKIEHNDYTGFELEPGTRLAWTPNDKQTVWASVARAVRTPSQFEHDASVNLAVLPANPPTSPFPTLVSIVGNPDFKSETLTAYELGYRIQAHRRFTLDLAGFVNDYDHLRGTQQQINAAAAPNYLQAQSVFNNGARGLTYGGELAATWQTLDWWRLHGQVSVIQMNLRQPPDSLTGEVRDVEGSSPTYQLSLRSSMELSKSVELDAWARYVDRLRGAGALVPGQALAGSRIPGYATFDLRLAWRPLKNLELSVVGQNLGGSHREFNPTFSSSQFTEVSRSVYGKVTWRF